MSRSYYNILAGALLMASLFACVAVSAGYDKHNSEAIRKIIAYRPDAQGYYIKESPSLVDSLGDGYAVIGKTNKSRTIYLQNGTSLYSVQLAKDDYKPFKDDKAIENLKDKDVTSLIDSRDEKLKGYFLERNWERQQFLADSLEEARKREELRRQQIADSIAKAEAALKDSLDAVEYRKTHKKYLVPNARIATGYRAGDFVELRCDIKDCYKRISPDTIFVAFATADSLMFATFDKPDFYAERTIPVYHLAEIPKFLRESEPYTKHIKAYGDSLLPPPGTTLAGGVAYFNAENYLESLEDAKKLAPYGYVDHWGWGDDYGLVSFNISYTNLNAKTIKYLQVFFKITNAVGDVRCTGHVRGTGPVEQYTTCSWSWDYTGYSVAGDATTMHLTKLVITYMDGKTRTIPAASIRYND